jgi:hypothetical protein
MVILFMLRYRLDYMESFLVSAKWVARVESNFGLDSWVSRFYRLNILNIMLFFPKTFAKRGEVKLDELYSIPKRLRYVLKGAYCLLVLVSIVIVISHFFIKYYKPN